MSLNNALNPQQPLGGVEGEGSFLNESNVVAFGNDDVPRADDLNRSGAYATTYTRSSPPMQTPPRKREEPFSTFSRPAGSTWAKKSPAATSAPTGEVFQSGAGVKREVTRFSRAGRRAVATRPFTSDVSVGKFGVLGLQDAEELEQRLYQAFVHDDLSLGGKSEVMRDDFLKTLFLFLAINSGSIGNTAGRLGVRDDSQPLQFGDVEVSAADVAAVLGDRAYAYMRARATEIRDTVESAFLTSRLPNAELQFPGVCRAVELIKTVAALKGISQCPQYVAVGSHYAADTPPYLVAMLQESAAKVLNATQGNVREASGPGSVAGRD